MRLIHCIALFAFSTASLVSHASTIIDFDLQAASEGAPTGFDGDTTIDSPLTLGIATFTGGELLLAESAQADQTGVYATNSLLTGYLDPLTIAFSQAISGFSVLLTNNLAGTFTVSDNKGGTQTLVLGGDVSQTFTLADNGVTSVTVKETGTPFDFAIDNVTFSPATVTSATPEPSAFILLGTGLVILAGAVRVKRFGF
jgi:hypothetical protein